MGHPEFPILEPKNVRLNLTLADRYATMMNAFKHQYFAWARHVAERYGWQVSNEIAQEVVDESIPVMVPGFRRRFGLTGEGPELVGKVVRAQLLADGSEPAVIRETTEHVEFDVRCMWGGALQSGKFPIEIAKGLCHEGCVGWAQRVAQTVDEGIKVERLTWMGEGAPRCHFRIVREG